MPSGIYKRTEKMKTGEHMLGRKLSEEWKNAISKAMRDKKIKPPSFLGMVHSKETKEKISKSKRNEKNPQWKGNKVGYSGLHHWIRTKLGKHPSHCEFCRRAGIENRGKWDIYYANRSGKYKRLLDDWLRLCQLCHMEYDKK